MSAFDKVRKAIPSLSNASEEEIIFELSRGANANPRDVAKAFGYTTGDERGALRSGLASGLDMLQGLGLSAGAGLADLAGLQQARDYLNRRAQINALEGELAGRPELERIEDQSLGTALPYAGYQIAKQVPTMAALIGAQFVPGVGQASTALGLTRLGAVAPRFVGGGGLEAGASMAARRAALEQGATLGSQTLAGSALGFGSLYGESVEGGQPAALKSLALAPFYGAAEAVLPAMVTRGVRAPGIYSGALPTRLLKSGAVAGAGEAGTELFQTELEMGMRADLSPEEKYSRRLNAAAAGALVGGTFGSVGGFRRRIEAGQEANLMPDLKDTAQQKPDPAASFNADMEVGLGLIPPINPYDVGGYVSSFQQGAETGLTPQAGLFGGGAIDLMTPAAAPATQVAQPTAAPTPAAPAVFDALDNELIARGVRPSKKARELYEAALNSGVPVDSSLFTPFWTSLSQNKYAQARDGLAVALISSRQEAQRGGQGTTTAVGSATGLGAGAPNIPGGVGVAGPVSGQPGIAGGTAPGVVAPGGENAILSPATQQPSAAVGPQVVTPPQTQPSVIESGAQTVAAEGVAPAQRDIGDGYASDSEAWDDFAPEGAPKFEALPQPFQRAWALARDQRQMTGELAQEISNESSIEPEIKEQQAAGETRQVLNQIFGERDASILYDVLVNKQDAAAVATKNKVSRGRVAQIAGSEKSGQEFRAKKILAAQNKFGWTDNYVRSLLNNFATAGRAAETETVTTEGNLAQDLGIRGDLGEAGFATIETEGGSTSDWMDTGEADTGETSDVAIRFTQAMFELRQKADALLADIRQARDSGRDFIATKDRKVPLSDKIKEYVELRRKARTELEKAKAVLEGQAQKGGRRAVQKPSPTPVPVRNQPEGGGKIRVRKPEGGQVAGAREAEKILTPKEQYEALTAGVPGAPDFAVVPDKQRVQITDLAKRGQLDLAAINRILSSVTASAEAQVTQDAVAPQVAALTAPQVSTLEEHYGVKSGTQEFLDRVKEDVVAYVTKGAQAVAEKIRAVIGKIAKGVLSAAVVFNISGLNPQVAQPAFAIPKNITVTQAQQDKGVRAQVGVRQLSSNALKVVNWIAANSTGNEVSLVLDPAVGKLYVMKGRRIVDDSPALYGKAGIGAIDQTILNSSVEQTTEEMKVTPAGRFPLKMVPSEEYGTAIDFLKGPNASFAIHRVYLGNPSERRADRLANSDPKNKNISYGCVNVSSDFYDNVLSKLDLSGSAFAYLLPSSEISLGKYFAMEQPVGAEQAAAKPSPAEKEPSKEQLPQAPGRGIQPTRVASLRRESRRVSKLKDQDGVEFTQYEITQQEAEDNYSGVGSAISHLRDTGFESSLGAVDAWSVTYDPVGWDAVFTVVDGKRTIILNGAAMEDEFTAKLSTLHEIGHAVENLQDGGDFSGDAQFNLRKQNGQPVAIQKGSVADELISHYKTQDSALSQLLAYPLDMADENSSAMSLDELRQELFAQVWAFSVMPDGMNFLKQNLPATANFLESVHEQVKTTNYAKPSAAPVSQPGQVPPGGQAEANVIRASRQAAQAVLGRNVRKLPPQMRQPVSNSIAALQDIGGKGLDYFVFTSDLIKRAVAVGLSSASKFERLLAARRSDSSAMQRDVERVADMYAVVEDEFKGSGPDSANQFIFDSTRTSKWGYGQYRDQEMGDRFDALGPKAQAFVRAVFAHGDKMLAQKKKIVLEATNSEYDALIQQAKDDLAMATTTEETAAAQKQLNSATTEKARALKEFASLFKIREGKPYAPIKRMGEWAVIAKSDAYLDAVANNDAKLIRELEKDPDHYHVSFVDSKWEARTLQQQLRDQGFFSSGEEGVQISERSDATTEAFGGQALLPALTKLRAKVGTAGESEGKLRSMISQLYLQALAENSARKSEMRRRGVAGEVDMLRSFTQQGRADAQFLSSVKYNPQIQETLQEMRSQEKTGDRARKSEILNELLKRYDDSLDYKQTPWVDALKRMSSVYFLATSPAYYLQNLTQPWMMSLPAMAGRHAYTKAAAALSRAYTELGPIMKATKLLDQQFDFSKVPQDVRAAIEELVNRGKIDIGMATELNEYKVEPDSVLGKVANKVDKSLRIAVQKVEATNRLSTAIAAYRLEMELTRDAKAALDYADRILTETHGDYTAFNAPRAFNTQWGKVALQFRKFQLIQLAFYSKLIKQALTDPTERAAALKTLAWSLGHTATLAGVMGLPGYAAISWAIGALLGTDDEPYDLTQKLRAALGPEWANLVMRGAPTLGGMDLSGKLGSGNMLSLMPFSNADLTTAAGQAEALGTLLGGASLGMTTRMIDGLLLMMRGDWLRGLARVTPKGVGDALNAGREATEGMTRRNGDIILPASEITAVETALKAIGVQSVKQAVIYERQQYVRDLNQEMQDRSTRIKSDYTKAVRNNDMAARTEAMRKWSELQDARMNQGYKRQPMSDLLRAPQEQAKRERQTLGGVQFNRMNRQLVEEVAAQ